MEIQQSQEKRNRRNTVESRVRDPSRTPKNGLWRRFGKVGDIGRKSRRAALTAVG